MRFPITLLLGIASFGIASGQTVGISGPVEGFTFDPPTASLRAVIGFPGAASFGPAILSGLELGSVAPQRNFALAFRDGNFVVIGGLDSGNITTLAVPGVTRVAGAVSWSADGSFAILSSAGGNWIQTLSGLPSNPLAGTYIDLSPLGGSLSAVSLDASGKQIAIAISGPEAGVFMMTASQGFAPVLALGNPVALAFSTDGSQLFAIDAATKQLATVNLSTLSFQMTALDGLADPFAVEESAAKIYIASRSDRMLRALTPSNGQSTDITLGFSPTGLQLFGANSLLAASRIQAADPLWLVTNGLQPAAFFVPAIPQTIGKPRPPSDTPVEPKIPIEEHR